MSATIEFANVTQTAPNTYTFRLTPAHVSYANTLRRLIMTGVETVAFRADMTDKGTTTDVQIIKNTTPMTNEMLAHRIGLLPLNIKEPLKWNPDRFHFRLTVGGSKDSIRDVFAGDFTVTEQTPNEVDPVKVDSSMFFPPHPITRQTCLIATLYPGDQNGIDIIAKATIGTGRQNARFQPTSQCSYTYTRDTDPVKIESYFKNWLLNAKKIAPDSLDKDSEKFKALQREFNTMEVARCYLQDERGEPYSFDFVVESAGVLEVPYIIQRACEVGEAMVARYSNIDSGELPEDVRVAPSDSRILGYDFIFQNQDHTLGNLLQTWLEQNHMTGAADRTQITFSGYDIPHPLRDEMLLRVGVEDGQEITARRAVAEACKGCIGMFRAMKNGWLRATSASSAAPATAPAAPKRTQLRKKIPEAAPSPV